MTARVDVPRRLLSWGLGGRLLGGGDLATGCRRATMQRTARPGPLGVPLRTGRQPPGVGAYWRGSASAGTAAAPVTPGTHVGPPLREDYMDFDVVRAAGEHRSRVAVAQGAHQYTYGAIMDAASSLAAELRDRAGNADLRGARVALMAPPGVEFVVGSWACWLSNAICVPLALSHPPAELQYVLQDAGVSTVVAHPQYEQLLRPLADSVGAQLHPLPEGCSAKLSGGGGGSEPPASSPQDGSIIIYTSGTTGRPKGVLHTRGSVAAQVASLSAAWEWRSEDHILHALPLHHVHGLVNALQCAHANGAAVEFAPFKAAQVWERLQVGDVSVFMGVPTMYSMLLGKYQSMGAERQAAARQAAADLRLTVSGSAACPLVVMQQWEALSGRPLLERYGMTEIGMALSNMYTGERRPGSVGLPLPGVEVKVVPPGDSAEEVDSKAGEGVEGELAVRGPLVFREYWGKPEATSESFDAQGFFLTGDTVQLAGQPPFWKIVGRTSVDIIKYSGYKISALDIENKLLQHPHIRECAVVGVPDEERGQLVGAVVGLREGAAGLEQRALRDWCADKMPPYHVPRRLVVVDAIPRNAMGKINKKQLVKDVFPGAPAA